MGVYLSTVTDDIAEDYDIPKGVYIKEVVTDSPAMKAGLQNGDVITHINGDSILTDALFSEKIAQLIPGTTCEISVKRQNGNEYYEVKCTVTIGVLQYINTQRLRSLPFSYHNINGKILHRRI